MQVVKSLLLCEAGVRGDSVDVVGQLLVLMHISIHDYFNGIAICRRWLDLLHL